MRLLILSLFLLIKSITINAQCVTYTSSCGYNVSIQVSALSIVPSSASCLYGYNYNVRFGYKIIVSGVNTCYNDNIGIQPQIICNSDNNGYYTINVPAPTVGSSNSNVTYTGTLTTTTNPFRSTTDCNTATPSSLGCNGLTVNMFGPKLNSSSTSPCLVTLPIELIEFKSSCLNRNIVIKWSTISETNNNYFVLEKSFNGVNWFEMEKVNGAGNSYYLLTYQYIDSSHTESDLMYYRLKQVDFDGTIAYSKLISTTNCSNDISSFYYNNETKQIIYKGIIYPNNALCLYNNMGQLVIKEKIEYPFLDVSFLNKGIYYIKYESNGNMIFKKILLTD